MMLSQLFAILEVLCYCPCTYILSINSPIVFIHLFEKKKYFKSTSRLEENVDTLMVGSSWLSRLLMGKEYETWVHVDLFGNGSHGNS